MKCPSCNTTLSQPAPQCRNCKLTLQQLDTKFGALPLHSSYLTDRSATLPPRAMNEVRALLQHFVQKFPQSLFSVFVVGRVPSGSIAEYTFWLANRGRFNLEEVSAGENFDILLGIDIQKRSAALTIGYGLENYLTDDDLEHALAEAATALQAGDTPGGIRNCVESMMNRMQEVSRKIEELRLAETAEPLGGEDGP